MLPFWLNSVVNSNPNKFSTPEVVNGKETGKRTPNSNALERAALLKNFGQVNNAEQRLITDTYDKAEEGWLQVSRTMRINIERENIEKNL